MSWGGVGGMCRCGSGSGFCRCLWSVATESILTCYCVLGKLVLFLVCVCACLCMWVYMCIWGLFILIFETRCLTRTWGSLFRLTGLSALLPMNHHAWPFTSVLEVKIRSSASTLWVSCLPSSSHFFLIVSKTGIKDGYFHADKLKKRLTGFPRCGERFWYQECDRKCQTLLWINGHKQKFKTGKYIMCRKNPTEYNLEQTWTS